MEDCTLFLLSCIMDIYIYIYIYIHIYIIYDLDHELSSVPTDTLAHKTNVDIICLKRVEVITEFKCDVVH